MLLKVDTDCQVGELASDGSIFAGETLLSMANPNDLVGSLLIGRSSYECVNDVTFPDPQDKAQCVDHKVSTDTVTPAYRQMGHTFNRKTKSFQQMGHTWNEASFFRSQDLIERKYRKFHPAIPIIQCHGFRFHPNASGAPVFNVRGKIVGMLNSKNDSADIAIHVTLLRQFLKELKRTAEKKGKS